MFTLTDKDGLSNGPSPYHIKGDGDIAVPHDTPPAGKWPQWQSTVPRTDKTYGDEGTGAWVMIDDYRKVDLYLTSDGSKYSIGTEVDERSYSGYGTLPAWLTATAKPGRFYNWANGAWVFDTAADLADAQATQSATMEQAYSTAISQPVSYTTTAGVTKTFQADADGQGILNKALNGYKAAGAVPEGFWWKSEDNTLVPFTLEDLVGLSSAMLAQGWAAFQTLAARKLSISEATTRTAAEAITWASPT